MDRVVNQITALFVACLIGIACFSFNLFVFKNDPQGLYDYKRIFICIIIISVGCLIIGQHLFREKLLVQLNTIHPFVSMLLITLFISTIIANLFGLYFFQAQTDFLYFLGLALFITAISCISYENRNRTYKYFSTISYLLFFSVLFGFGLVIVNGNNTSIHSIISFVNPRMLNQVQSWIIVPTFYLAVLAKHQLKSYSLALLPLILNVSIIFALDSRGIAIGSISAILLWALFDKPLRKTIFSVLIHSIIIGYLVKLIFLSPLPEYLYLGTIPEPIFNLRASSSGRILIWKEALQMASFWGHGGDAYICNSSTFGHPHNSILLILVNWGAIATISYVLLLLYGLKTVYITKHRVVRVTGLSVLSGFAYSLISGVVDTPLSQLTGAISIALFWAACNHFSNRTIADTVLGNSMKKHILLMFSSIMIVGLVGYKVYQRIDNDHYRDMPVDKIQFWFGQNCIDEEPRLQLKNN